MVKQLDREWDEIAGGTSMLKVEPESQTRKISRFRRADLPIDTAELARFLIGKTLVHDLPIGRLSGRIVETEAYPIGDPAGHAFRGLTPANRSLFLAHGHAYVHFTYGSCWLMNVSSETPGVGGGVLIRAIEPVDGIAWMERHRGISQLRDLARGPGRLAAALLIDKRFDGLDLCSPSSPLWLGAPLSLPCGIGTSRRIGISRAAHRRLRFYERGNPFVSGPVRLRQ